MVSLAGLWGLVETLHGHDMHKMSAQMLAAWKAEAVQIFARHTAALPAVLLPSEADFERLSWHVGAPPVEGLEWLATFQLRSTDDMEACVGHEDPHFTLAAAAWPDVKVTVDLNGDYHYPGGLNSIASLTIAVHVEDGPGFWALQHVDNLLCSRIQELSKVPGIELVVCTREDAVDDQRGPPSLAQAMSHAIEGAIEAAESQGHGNAESVEIRLTLFAGCGLTPEVLDEATRAMGSLFHYCDQVVARA